MNEWTNMTALQMYLELQRLGLQSAAAVPLTPTMPSAYHYVPTRLAYSTDESYAELVRGAFRDSEGGDDWKSEGTQRL
jgi:hypothetical protein